MKLVFPPRPTYFLLWLCIMGYGCESGETAIRENEPSAKPPLFNLLSPQQTRVQFQNTLTEGLNTNILMYEYFYNGGGVAAGDFNGDGLIDLYFTANMSDNKLYLNQGGMRFQDITAASGTAGRPGPWKTGVSIVDINGDGRLDLYVCYSGALPEPKRANQLFVNQGNDALQIPRFREAAAEYGLASTAFSNQGYFLDYDRDGDLDMLLLNHNPKSLPVLNEASTAEFLKQDDPLRGVRVFRQSDGKFEDVTVQVGVNGSALTYGLGLGITDINQDGWPDFYVSNDYAVPDYLYLNNGNGTFTNKLNESVGHNSQFSMGNDIADINNDGLPDIFTLDMLPEDNYRQKLLLSPDNYAKFNLNVRSGFHYQYMRNMLQLNNGDGSFSEIGQLAGISNTDWSWAALLADYNNDGWKDLFVTNGYKRDYTNLDFIKYMDSYVQNKGRLRREDVLEIINHMPASNVTNYLFANQAGRTFSNVTGVWGMTQASNSNGAAYADLDNDGDLDLVVNNINQPAFIYQNEAQSLSEHHFLQIDLLGQGLNTMGLGARIDLYYQGMQQSLEQSPGRGYLSAVSPILHVGLGAASRVDSLVVSWVSGKQQTLSDLAVDQVLTLREADAQSQARPASPPQPYFRAARSRIQHQNFRHNIHDFDRQTLLINGLSYEGPCMIQGDVNADGRQDVFIGGAAGQAGSLFLQQPNKRFVRQHIPALEADKASEDAEAAWLDANGDGHLDLYVVSGGYHAFQAADPLLQDRLYLNDGQGRFTRQEDALPSLLTSGGCVVAHDLNQDGHTDLFVGGRVIPGRYPEAPRSYVLINDGQGKFTDQTAKLAPTLQQIGMVTDAAWADLDQDQGAELIVVGEWLPVSVFKWENGKLENRTETVLGKAYGGWWNAITLADLNQDGRTDLLAGNMGTNTQFRVSDQEPAELYYHDFDQSGSVDPFFCFYIKGRSYPYVTRDELLRQLTRFSSRFPSYESYADITLPELFSPEELAQAGRWQANHMETTFFLSQPDGSYAPANLPLEAQYAPVYTLTILDFNQDGSPDVLLCGNNSHTKLRLGKADANYGVLLQGDGQGGFHYVSQPRSGFTIRGDVRSALLLESELFLGLNQGPVLSYQLQE